MYYNRKVADVLLELGTSEDGLSLEEAARRLEKYGENIIPSKKKKSVFMLFFSEFKNPITLLLILAIVASIFVGEYVDAIAIAVIILVDATIGTYQEYKANMTIDSLEKLVKEESVVLRDGHATVIPSSVLTIGDVVTLESGDKIPADMRVIDAHNFMVDESILTGESNACIKTSEVIVRKNIPLVDQTNMLFAGTSVVRGRATAVVVNVGINTELGLIAKSIHEQKQEKSPLTIRIDKFSKTISILLLIISILLAILLFYKGVSYDEIFLSIIALSVSAMPEGLPLALTMALSIASSRMAKKNCVVRELNSIESLGSCTVIASDKTGTLTVNEQTARKILLADGDEYEISGMGYNEDGEITGKHLDRVFPIIALGVINNEAIIDENKKIGDAIDLAFLVLGKKANVDISEIEILESIPYESENGFSAVFYNYRKKNYCTIKGSLEVIKKYANMDVRKVEKQNTDLAKSGYRVIAVANGQVKKKKSYSFKDIDSLEFLGLVGFIDPVRKDAKKAIASCAKAGIRVMMITGDHPLTALSIGKDLGLVESKDELITGDMLEKSLKKDNYLEFDELVASKKIFARVTPILKLKIVESLKRQGEYVAVTGDGVNDAPALKAANIGIAMGSGSDIAEENSNMVILDDNFKSIVAGIEEGRIAYSNIRKIVWFLISCGLAEVLFFALAILFDMPIPLLAIQLLWLNVVTDGIQDLALSFEKNNEDLMSLPPRKPSEGLFNRKLSEEILLSGLSIGLIVFGLYYLLLNVLKLDLIFSRSCVMALMVFIQNIHVFNCRSEVYSAFKVPLKKNKFILVAFVSSILLEVFVSEIPVLSSFLSSTNIPFWFLAILFLIASAILFIVEIYKYMSGFRGTKSNSNKDTSVL